MPFPLTQARERCDVSGCERAPHAAIETPAGLLHLCRDHLLREVPSGPTVYFVLRVTGAALRPGGAVKMPHHLELVRSAAG